jgi:ABC-type branched-subunit amino acid transport system substrate-binding protein
VLALEQFPLLAQQPQQATLISSGSLPDADFTERYINSAEFTPQPGLLATVTYDATNTVIQALTDANNGGLAGALASINYTGLNGKIQFKDGYWVNAPIHYFSYDRNGNLIPVDRPIK